METVETLRGDLPSDDAAEFAPSPGRVGFRMPAEWELHRATWIVWPHNRSDWEGKLAAVHWAYVEIVKQLVEAGGESVEIIIGGARQEERARRQLERSHVDLAGVRFHAVATDRSWIRDFGPLFATRASGSADGGPDTLAVDFRFNAWARYANWQCDDIVIETLSRRLGWTRHTPTTTVGGDLRRVVLEGGSIDVDGQGRLLTTEVCLLGQVQERNPGMNREAVEAMLADTLGSPEVIWLGDGIAGDDTHGHVDDIARFVPGGRVVVAVEDNPSEANHAPLAENRRRLEEREDLEVVPIPMPRPRSFEGLLLPASYLNFYIANRAVLVPTFNDPADRVALNTLADVFPDRDVVGIHAVDLVLGQGSVHCLTMQEPAAIRNPQSPL